MVAQRLPSSWCFLTMSASCARGFTHRTRAPSASRSRVAGLVPRASARAKRRRVRRHGAAAHLRGGEGLLLQVGVELVEPARASAGRSALGQASGPRDMHRLWPHAGQRARRTAHGGGGQGGQTGRRARGARQRRRQLLPLRGGALPSCCAISDQFMGPCCSTRSTSRASSWRARPAALSAARTGARASPSAGCPAARTSSGGRARRGGRAVFPRAPRRSRWSGARACRRSRPWLASARSRTVARALVRSLRARESSWRVLRRGVDARLARA